MAIPTHQKLLFVILIALALSGTAGYFAYEHYKAEKEIALAEQKKLQEEQQQKELAKKKAEAEQKRQEIQALFDKYLNNFTNDLKDKAKKYKETKKVMKLMTLAYNYETPEDAKNIYTMFNEDIAPSLNNQANTIIGTFEEYKKLLENDIGTSDEIGLFFQNQWHEMHEAELERYVNFFIKEEIIRQAYSDLIKFYYIHSKLYKIENDTFVFQRPEDEQNHQELLKVIDDLEAKK